MLSTAVITACCGNQNSRNPCRAGIGNSDSRYNNQGNPESADMVIARGSHLFVADKLSDLNKDQLDGLGVHWVELRQYEGYKRFQLVLEELDIPHTVPDEDLSTVLPEILDTVL